MAFGILLKTVNAWGGSAQQPNQASATENSGLGQPLPGFEQFMFENIVRVCFEVPMKQSFNLSDGQTVAVSLYRPFPSRTLRILSFSYSRISSETLFLFFLRISSYIAPSHCHSQQVFGEISGILKAIYTKQGARFIEYMGGVYLPSIQCPQNMSEEYLHALQQLDVRAFKKFFQVIFWSIECLARILIMIIANSLIPMNFCWYIYPSTPSGIYTEFQDMISANAFLPSIIQQYIIPKLFFSLFFSDACIILYIRDGFLSYVCLFFSLFSFFSLLWPSFSFVLVLNLMFHLFTACFSQLHPYLASRLVLLLCWTPVSFIISFLCFMRTTKTLSSNRQIIVSISSYMTFVQFGYPVI